ncbi:thiamine biosynthesis protein ThiF [Candidatus Epulonipiscium fishelsonii]|uniref:Thiamine biosynthesis protein ThiF n=1 Tax=Candidatus Epulonipiscium fishelsonii TaxID=77094 RepID=A0ACC8XBG8_9FIRM|nr:thiamine biosynthesis protein ThiF [Epulopiscium sp. SCG-B11WGA-EpuloA1]ONI41273.1 thiamine biosynthesis protein ThiF [Epulopiscium sp. SCG-B05WGA-EpuloA1]
MKEKLLQSKVAIAGAGGLGSNIAVMLARSNVGEIFIVDFDKVDKSNLNRQHYSEEHLGRYKTEALAEQINKINPAVNFIYKTVKVTADNIVELFKDYKIVCEAFDNPVYKAMLVENLLIHTKATIISGSGMAGYSSGNNIKTHKKLSRLYVCGDLESDIASNCIMSPRVQICAGHQANMIIRLILGENTP